MIEFKLAKDGSRIFTWHGRHLCSSYKPADEATLWAEKSMRKVASEKSIVVLGLANGYHVSAISRLNPGKDIYVINANEEFVSPALNILDLQSCLFEILTANNLSNLKRQSKFRKIFRSSFVLLEFLPATQLHVDFYQKVRDQLLGRTQDTLKFYLECRVDVWSRLDCSKLKEKKSAKGIQLLSFKDLDTASRISFEKSRQTNLIGVLQELIK